MHRVPGHDFNNIAILQEPDLLGELQQLMTTKPSAVIAGPTGMPPHVETNGNLFIIITELSDVLELQKGVDTTIVETVTTTLKDWAVAAGQPTVAALESPLDKKFAVCERIQKEGAQVIANAQKLSILDNGDDA